MNKSTEIRRKLDSQKTEMLNLYNSGNKTKALEIANNIDSLKKDLKIAETEEGIFDMSNSQTITSKNEVIPEQVLNKCLFNKTLTDSEAEYANKYLNASAEVGQLGSVDERGGYLLTKEQETDIKTFRRNRASLKTLVNVKKVSSRTGSYVTEGENNLELINFDELSDLTEKDVKFAKKEWSVRDYGLLLPVAKQLTQDISANLMGFIGDEFAKASINTENKVIAAELEKLTVKTIKNYDGIKTILNVDLDPAISSNAKIITNQTSFDYLDSLKDENGHDILQPVLTDPTKRMFRGRTIEVFPDEIIKPKTPKNMVFYVGDPAEYLRFYEKLGTEIARSEEAGFKQYATWLRVVQRFDTGVFDEKALVRAELKPEVITEP